MPFFSVLLPVCNSESTILECLLSISTQKFQDFSVLILVNNSDDSSFGICSKFCQTDARFQVLNLFDNYSSLPDVLNFGINYLRSECHYIVRHDADDYMLPLRLSDTYQAIIASSVPPLIHCGNAFLNDTSNLYFTGIASRSDYEIKSTLLLSSPFIHPAISFKSSIQSLYDTRFVYAQDLKFFIDNMFSGTYSFSSTAYIRYATTPPSIIKRSMQLSLHDFAIHSLHKKLIPDFKLSLSHQLRCRFVTNEFALFTPLSHSYLDLVLKRLKASFDTLYASSTFT